ncbi:hypothetical protein DSO57_1007381 [Entomophthora muscae]|uniref:Uncharacterized protein n=1 Tax=Entomophthora muscae TaxID=34485 RepID=A0ACC2TUV3_9FUNG|nr:hypothetical protein DSO57_1007381 [Entomophthora muscae]
MTYYKDFDCPLVAHLKIEEDRDLADRNFSSIIKIFPALKTLDYTGPYLKKHRTDHFVYDVENLVFKEISLSDTSSPAPALISFRDDIPLKTPLLPSDQEVTHESQFHAFYSIGIYKFFELIPQITCLDAIDVTSRFLEQEKFVELLLSLKDIRSLSFDIGWHDLSYKFSKETFKAATVFLLVPEIKLPVILEFLASCFPNLKELGIHLIELPDNHEARDSQFKHVIELWGKLIENCSNLSKIHLSNGASYRCQIKPKYPHIQVDNKYKARYYERKDIF